jgi:hypothetical protein
MERKHLASTFTYFNNLELNLSRSDGSLKVTCTTTSADAGILSPIPASVHPSKQGPATFQVSKYHWGLFV